MQQLGVIKFADDGWPDWQPDADIAGDLLTILSASDVHDPREYVASANVHRRHLTAEQKRVLIATLLKMTPEKSNRQVAALAKADDKTVATVRRDLEATAEIPQLTRTTGKDGKARTTKPAPVEKPKAEAAAKAPKPARGKVVAANPPMSVTITASVVALIEKGAREGVPVHDVIACAVCSYGAEQCQKALDDVIAAPRSLH
jgi:hypothetical protein